MNQCYNIELALTCSEIKELEKRLQELEARPHLEKLEVENKENIASIEGTIVYNR